MKGEKPPPALVRGALRMGTPGWRSHSDNISFMCSVQSAFTQTLAGAGNRMIVITIVPAVIILTDKWEKNEKERENQSLPIVSNEILSHWQSQDFILTHTSGLFPVKLRAFVHFLFVSLVCDIFGSRVSGCERAWNIYLPVPTRKNCLDFSG